MRKREQVARGQGGRHGQVSRRQKQLRKGQACHLDRPPTALPQTTVRKRMIAPGIMQFLYVTGAYPDAVTW